MYDFYKCLVNKWIQVLLKHKTVGALLETRAIRFTVFSLRPTQTHKQTQLRLKIFVANWNKSKAFRGFQPPCPTSLADLGGAQHLVISVAEQSSCVYYIQYLRGLTRNTVKNNKVNFRTTHNRQFVRELYFISLKLIRVEMSCINGNESKTL